MLLPSVPDDSDTYETTRRSISSKSRNAATFVPGSVNGRESRGSVAINGGFYTGAGSGRSGRFGPYTESSPKVVASGLLFVAAAGSGPGWSLRLHREDD